MNTLSTAYALACLGCLAIALWSYFTARAVDAAAVLHARETRHVLEHLMTEYKALRRDCEDLRARIETASTAKLRADLDSLVSAIETDRAARRIELGKLWARLGGSQTAPDDKQTAAPATAGELDEWLALQRSFNGGGG